MMVFCDEHKPSQAAEMNGDELQLSVMASATSYLSVPACSERKFVFKGPVRDFFRAILAYVSTNSRFHHCQSWYNKEMRESRDSHCLPDAFTHFQALLIKHTGPLICSGATCLSHYLLYDPNNTIRTVYLTYSFIVFLIPAYFSHPYFSTTDSLAEFRFSLQEHNN